MEMFNYKVVPLLVPYKHFHAKLFSNSIDFTTIKLIIYNFILYYITKKINNMITPVSLISILEFYAIVYFTFIGIMIFTKQVDIKKILKILSKNNESTSL